MKKDTQQPERAVDVGSTRLLGRAVWWLFTLSLIPIGWKLYAEIGDVRWGRTVVGIINCINGMAFAWMLQAWRHRPNAAGEQPAPKTKKEKI